MALYERTGKPVPLFYCPKVHIQLAKAYKVEADASTVLVSGFNEPTAGLLQPRNQIGD
jgi:hypothetical protein